MSRAVKLVSTVAVLGLLAGCGGSTPAAEPAPGAAGAPAGVGGGDAARALATQRVLNGLRVRGHHNVRRPRHLASNG